MRTRVSVIGLLLMLVFSTISAGCLGLVMQRELMEDLRKEPFSMPKEESYYWEVTFTSDTIDFESIQYTNQTKIVFDKTVSKLSITFKALFPYSSILEEVVPNGTNEYRYVEAKIWEPGVKEQGGNPYWEVRATQDYPLERFEFSDITNGSWSVEIEARGYGFDGIEQASFHDYFEMSVTITKPCIQFAEIHEGDECTYLSELQNNS